MMSPEDQELADLLDGVSLDGQESWKEKPELGLDPDDDEDAPDEEEELDDLDDEDDEEEPED